MKDGERNVIARHGLRPDGHQNVLQQASQAGLSPVAVSVVSVAGERRYTVLYRPVNIGRWKVRSDIPVDEFQSVFDAMRRDGLAPNYVAAYRHDGTFYFSVVFASADHDLRVTRHGMSPDQYQDEWEEQMAAGRSTRAVTGYDGAAGNHRYVAVWQ